MKTDLWGQGWLHIQHRYVRAINSPRRDGFCTRFCSFERSGAHSRLP